MEETEDHEPLYQEKFTLGERGQKNCIKCGVGAKEGCSQHAVLAAHTTIAVFAIAFSRNIIDLVF
jgi:hypothetical protein